MRSSHQQRPLRPSAELVALLDKLQKLRDRDEVRFCADTPPEIGCVLFSGDGEALTNKGRQDLLKQLRAGEIVELELEAVTYIQRATPNRNFVRFKPGMLATFAKSFTGQPVLRDHASYSMTARGGTILKSTLEHNEDGTKQIRMRLKLSAPWMVEAALMGLMDRFSIGWSRTGPIECSACEANIMKCDHWPGDLLADGTRVEFVFTAADGTEVSGVNVPAVVGTKVEGIQQLSALDRAHLADILADEPQPQPRADMDPELLKQLGLPSTATLAEALAAIQRNKDALTLAEGQGAATKTQLDKLQSERDAEATRAREALVASSISQLISAGKLLPGSELEAALRRQAATSLDTFQAYVKDLLATGAQLSPVGAKQPAATPEPLAASDGEAYLRAQPESAKWLAKAGVTKEQFEKHGAKAREIVAGWR